MQHTAGLSNSFWELAVNAAVHIYNCSPTQTLKWHTPHEAWYSGKVPDVSHLCVFRCKGYMRVPTDKHRELDAKAMEVMLVGFEPDAKGYKLWDSQTHSICLSRDVTFDESSFPSLRGTDHPPAHTSTVSTLHPHMSVTAAPHLPAPPPLQAPSPAFLHSSKEDGKLLLDPTIEEEHPLTPPPPPHSPTPPTTPQCPCNTPTSPPSHQRATCVSYAPPSLLSPQAPDMPGGFEDCAQHQSLLRVR